jgi:hypothetical protein
VKNDIKKENEQRKSYFQSLFNAINSSGVMKYFQFISAKPFLNNDFVYLVALFHTLLLLVFCIPIKIKFNFLKMVQDAAKGADGKTEKIWSFLSDSLPAILVTSSPLITGLLQNAINTFINK